MKRFTTTFGLVAALIFLIAVAAGAQTPKIADVTRLGYHNLGKDGPDSTLGAVVNFAGVYVLHQRNEKQWLTQLSLDAKLVLNCWVPKNGDLVRLAGDWDGKVYLAAVVAANKTFRLIDQTGKSLSTFNPGPNVATIICAISNDGAIELFSNSTFGQLIPNVTALAVVEKKHLALAVKQGRTATVVFYDANGLSLWARGFIGNGQVWPDYVVISRVSGDVIVAGRAIGSVIFGADTVDFQSGDSFVWRLSANNISRGVVVLGQATLAGIVPNNVTEKLHCGGNASTGASITASGKTFALQPGGFFLRLDGIAVYALLSGQPGTIRSVEAGAHGETWLGGHTGDSQSGDWFLAAFSNGNDARQVFRLDRQVAGFQSVEMLARRDSTVYALAAFDSTFRFGPSLVISENGYGGDVLVAAYQIRYGGGTTGISEKGDGGVPHVFSIAQNYPNPFSAVTDIHYWYDRDLLSGDGRILIYDLTGRQVRAIPAPMSQLSAQWDGRDMFGRLLPSGVYFYRFWVGGELFAKTRKMTIIR